MSMYKSKSHYGGFGGERDKLLILNKADFINRNVVNLVMMVANRKTSTLHCNNVGNQHKTTFYSFYCTIVQWWIQRVCNGFH